MSKQNKSKSLKKSYIDVINKFLVVVVLTLITMILLKSNVDFKEKFHKYVYEKNINFAYFNNLYQKYFGKPIPDIDKSSTKEVFSEKIEYSSKNNYLDGVELTIDNNYPVPSINSGMVIYKGKKDGYNESIVIEQVDGTQVLYGNIKSDLKMYDYVEKGSIIGISNNKLYLTFKRDGNILNYEDFI
ncbi:MAG: M23 family metallopeptidase [Bacilli bacterium]|nr:M23 family metallopeptidase [Bacilli bacterium]